MRHSFRNVLAALAVAVPLLNASPASAATTGYVDFELTGSFTVPCSSCTSPTLSASLVAGSVTSGTASAIPTGLTMRLTYTEPGCPTSSGDASGTMTITGTNVTGTLLPITVGFSWTRYGTVAVIPRTTSIGGALVIGYVVFDPPPPCFGHWSPQMVGHLDFTSP